MNTIGTIDFFYGYDRKLNQSESETNSLGESQTGACLTEAYQSSQFNQFYYHQYSQLPLLKTV
jgi:hypothetical protein